ncbi:hypothetical protein EYF80_034234 [Liparis tanakae]|uniref:Uncharacterized protein n=1 Tax=Liparis tanakae TaxID=230148 RepID=A0A4Z2GQ49_9TELE|nr:hypothetical protein EYF80_034234 [Liparis tanakae]
MNSSSALSTPTARGWGAQAARLSTHSIGKTALCSLLTDSTRLLLSVVLKASLCIEHRAGEKT